MADDKTRKDSGSTGAPARRKPIDIVILDPDSPERGLIKTLPADEAEALIAKVEAREVTANELLFGRRA